MPKSPSSSSYRAAEAAGKKLFEFVKNETASPKPLKQRTDINAQSKNTSSTEQSIKPK